MEYVSKSSLWIGIFLKSYTMTDSNYRRTIYRAGVAVVSTITNYDFNWLLYEPKN